MTTRSSEKRVSARKFRYDERDLALIEEVFSDPLFLRFMQPRKGVGLTSSADLEMRLLRLTRESSVGHDGLRVIYSHDEDEPVGICGILVNKKGLGLPELSIYVRKGYRGQGLATKSIELVSCHCSGQRLGAFVDYENQRSQRLMESVGLISSGVIYHSRLEREGLLYTGEIKSGNCN